MEAQTNAETETKTSEKLPLELVKKMQEYFDPGRLVNLLMDVLRNEEGVSDMRAQLERLRDYKERKREDPNLLPQNLRIPDYLIRYV